LGKVKFGADAAGTDHITGESVGGISMGNEDTILSEADARHLLRRAGFNISKRTLKSLIGKSRGRAADTLLHFVPARFRPSGRDLRELHDSWVNYMIRTGRSLQEKLVLFWHDHFSTSYDTVPNLALLANQNRLLRQFCKGNFKDFVKAINKDAAMMEFLDTVRNTKYAPNENYARELQELFTLGVADLAGNANYTQADIVQIARAFSGWKYYTDRDTGKPYGLAYLSGNQHDAGATKTIYTTVGGFGASGRSITANGVGEAEIDTVIDIIFDHTDSDGKSTVARYIARKLLAYFAHANPDVSTIDDVVTASGFASTWDIGALMRAIFVHDFFYVSGARAPFDAASHKSVKWPVHYVVSTLRQLKMTLTFTSFGVTVNGRHERRRYYHVFGTSQSIQDQLGDMGQLLFEPPSVFGWDWEAAWINSGTLLSRFTFARDVIAARDTGTKAFRPQTLIDLSLTDAGDIVDAVSGVLGVTDQLTATERDILIAYLTDNGVKSAPFDLTDETFRNTKLHGVFELVLQSPAFQLQ